MKTWRNICECSYINCIHLWRGKHVGTHMQKGNVCVCVYMVNIAGMQPYVKPTRLCTERLTKLSSYCIPPPPLLFHCLPPFHTHTAHMCTDSVNKPVRAEEPWQSLIHYWDYWIVITAQFACNTRESTPFFSIVKITFRQQEK